MTQPYEQNNLAIFAYGSLLSEPGEKIVPHIIDRIPYRSPWPIENARRAKLRGNGPTLVIHKAGGIVQGQLLILDFEVSALDELRELLWERLSMKLVKPFFRKYLTPPDASSEERCWPGGSFHRKVYGRATLQR